jgi:glycosyltransferase involved in cell wall biosynthesis
MKREHMCDMSKVTYLGNGIDIDRFCPGDWGDDERARRRKELGLNPKGPIVGMVGRFVAGKGYRELCEAIGGLASKHPDIQVLAIGTRPSIERSEELVPVQDDPRVGDRFICLYDREDMEDLYRLMDVFVLPSYREGFPRAPMEASASGIASIVTDVRGCRQAVTDGDNGLIIPPKDPAALQSAIDRLLSDSCLRAELGRRGRQRAEREFDQRIVFERVAACYERLLKESGIWPN